MKRKNNLRRAVVGLTTAAATISTAMIAVVAEPWSGLCASLSVGLWLSAVLQAGNILG
jgi:hypothetical protein